MEIVKLSQAPVRFFDQAKWGEYVDVFGGLDRALKRLNEPDPAALVWIKRLNAQEQNPVGALARRELAADDMADALVADLSARLARGEILGSGLTQTAVERVTIPAERWPGLKLDFTNCRAEGQVSFEQVLLWLPEPTSLQLEVKLSEWLRDRQAEGVSLKKQLMSEALVRFPALKIRGFNSAYKSVFGLTVGRPRKPSVLTGSFPEGEEALRLHSQPMSMQGSFVQSPVDLHGLWTLVGQPPKPTTGK